MGNPLNYCNILKRLKICHQKKKTTTSKFDEKRKQHSLLSILSISNNVIMSTPSLLPPFTRDAALIKVKKAQDLWNEMDPIKVSKAYTEDSIWRNS